MASRHRFLAAAILAASILSGCATSASPEAATPSAVSTPTEGSSSDGAVTPSASPTPAADEGRDSGALLEEALAAREAQDPQRFADLVAEASASCPDADAARRLGEVSAIAGRWADSLAFARPKVQARTEAQLAEVDWAALIAACSPS